MNDKKLKTTEPNYNKEHRQRVYERIKKNGVRSLANYEILEYILFHCIPRKDTKRTANDILEAFDKNLHAIFDAHYKEIMRRTNVTERTALFLSSFSDIAYEYQRSKFGDKRIYFTIQIH
ncbi:MAG: hypothetical protein FWE33_06860 [Defluviitaleaceae bacterium]|nr:hypothetical protein [Defluviitaleaceae bacterium]